MEKVFVLVISMWGFDGSQWQSIGSQMVLNHEMSQEQCEKLASDECWSKHFDNEYYMMQLDCWPE